MATSSDSNVQLDRSGDLSLNLSLSSTLLNASKNKSSGIPLMPGLRPDVYTAVSNLYSLLPPFTIF